MKRLTILIVALALVVARSFAQQNIKEEIYLHLASTDLIVGENLNFSAYTYSELTGRLSQLSSLIYVEIIDEKGNPVFQGKYPQVNGRASGDVFLNTDLESGNYRVVAYTRWMMNFDQKCQKNISIVNPYKSYRKSTLEEETSYSLNSYFEGGAFVSGFKNRVVFSLKDQNERPVQLKARILEKGGEKIGDLHFDEMGLASFAFTPKAQTSYQVALELPSSFQFIDLPAACSSCTQLVLKDFKENIILKVNSVNEIEGKIGVLEIWGVEGLVERLNSTGQSEHILAREDLPNGRLAAKLIFGDRVVNERVFWNRDLNNLIQIEPLVYGVDSPIERKIELPDVGSYSVSVKKVYGYENQTQLEVDKILLGSGKNRVDINKENLSDELLDQLMIMAEWRENVPVLDSVALMPEYKSGIVQGRVVSNSHEDFSDVDVALSFQGSQMELDAYRVDKEGRFILKYDPYFSNEKGVVKVLNDKDGRYEVELIEEFYDWYEPYSGLPLQIDSNRMNLITQRAIANQIQNAYFEADEVTDSVRVVSTFGNMKSYLLDEYTRFKTMRDTFIELVYEVGVSKNESNYRLNMRTVDISFNDKTDVETMVLLDGAFSTSEDILMISPYLVERIDVLDRRYFIGDVMFDGIISIHTFEGDGGDTEPFGKSVVLSEIQTNSEVTETDMEERAPKFNDLLHWNPCIQADSKELHLKFKTSQVEGLYEIRLEGITKQGQPYSYRSTFEVEKTIQ